MLLVSRVALLDHPTPVHGDELEFISAIGFPAAYPVHQPGYPLWVAMGTLLSRCGAPPYAAYQAWSVVCSVLAPWLLYLALRREVDDAIGWWIALAMGVCPLTWFMGTTALNYSAACAAGLLVAMNCRRAVIDQSAAHMRWAAACLTFSMQLRPDLLLWLGPMVLATAWRFKRADRVFCLLVLAMGTAWVFGVQSWLYGRAPVMGGVPQVGHTVDVILKTSVFRLGAVDGLLRNAAKLVAIAAWQVGLPLVICAGGCLLRQERLRPATVGAFGSLNAFLLVWMLPLTAFLVLIHMTEAGHTLLLIPAVYWLIAHLVTSRCTRRRGLILAISIAVASALQFSLYPWSAESKGFKRTLDAKVAYISAAGLRHIDDRDLIHTPGDYWRTGAHDSE